MSEPPLVKGGQSRDAKDVTGDAALVFTLAAFFLLLLSYLLASEP